MCSDHNMIGQKQKRNRERNAKKMAAVAELTCIKPRNQNSFDYAPTLEHSMNRLTFSSYAEDYLFKNCSLFITRTHGMNLIC